MLWMVRIVLKAKRSSSSYSTPPETKQKEEDAETVFELKNQ